MIFEISYAFIKLIQELFFTSVQSSPFGYWTIYFADLYHFTFYYLTAIVVFVFFSLWVSLSTFYFRVRGDFSNSLDIREFVVSFRRVSHNEKLEFWWTIVPSMIIFFIAMPALVLIYVLETPLHEPVLTVKAVGHQWYWSYEYTDRLNREIFGPYSDKSVLLDSYMKPTEELELGQRRLLETDRPLVLPVETPIRFLVTSGDVIHSWAVPALGVKMDAIPGRLNQFPLYIPFQGVYYGQCSELCGVNHGFMPICIYAVNQEDFVAWYLKNCK
jgi:cytochrome c oxidase subunit II